MYTNFLHIIDVLGTFAFAVSGVFSAMERRLDPFGILIIAFVTAIGGGTVRDLLVGHFPVAWLRNEDTMLLILVAATATMLAGSYLKKLNTALFLFDALGLGLFTIIGIEVGLQYGLSAGVCVALGTITACFGGVLRDVLLNKVPLIFQREIYALACIIGGVIYFYTRPLFADADLLKVGCILLIFFIRIIAVRFGLSLPRITIKQT
ncbi:MAG TPA: trimeric intracellular cation channel family protein [Flavisolibacter sp.]|nr:trimeric intracellular cation channel family protein [Flavisolibacter sp.]